MDDNYSPLLTSPLLSSILLSLQTSKHSISCYFDYIYLLNRVLWQCSLLVVSCNLHVATDNNFLLLQCNSKVGISFLLNYRAKFQLHTLIYTQYTSRLHIYIWAFVEKRNAQDNQVYLFMYPEYRARFGK